MVRRLSLTWPDAAPFAERGGRAIRWLVVSDDPDPVLAHATNRAELGPVDAVIGCGDLEPDYLGFLADAFAVPLSYVRGNHDKGGRWEDSVAKSAPGHLASGRMHRVTDLPIAALEWPGLRHGDRLRHDGTAWTDAIRVAGRRAIARFTRADPALVVISHAPPRGLGDRAADRYHAGYAGYRWFLDRTHPRLWLHGHVPPASVDAWRVEHAGTEIVNATGAVLIEILAPPDLQPPAA